MVRPYGGQLDDNNIWIRLSKVVPWERLNELYNEHFKPKRRGKLKDFRLMMGLMIGGMVKGLSDREKLNYFYENPYFQYFCGMDTFVTPTKKKVVHPSLLSKWRCRLGPDYYAGFEEAVTKVLRELKVIKTDELMLDATVFESNITYPNDVKLMNTVREWCCKHILELKNRIDPTRHVRTYRRKAKQLHLNFQKKKKKSRKLIQKSKKQMAQYMNRNIKQLDALINEYIEKGCHKKDLLSACWLAELQTHIKTGKQIYEQQWEMIKTKTHTVKDRIVSFHEPQVRPIVQGKEKAAAEFGPKAHLSYVDGFVFMDKLSFNAFSEKKELLPSLTMHHDRFGALPKRTLIDDGYSSRDNRTLLNERDIQHSLKHIGKPSPKQNAVKRALRKKRSEIEGAIGHIKIHWSLKTIIYKGAQGAPIQTHLAIGCHNLMKALTRV